MFMGGTKPESQRETTGTAVDADVGLDSSSRPSSQAGVERLLLLSLSMPAILLKDANDLGHKRTI